MLSTGRRPWPALTGRVLVVATCTVAALFAYASWQHAAAASNDFQWSGARLLLHGLDPYEALFRGDTSAFQMTQFPNYAPLLYVLLLPLAVMSLAHAQAVWAVLNLAMFLAASVLVARGADLRGWQALGFTALLFCSEPFCAAAGTGQQTALVLLAAVLAVRSRRQWVAGAEWAVMLVKYSFAPVALVPVMTRRWATVAVAVAVELVGLLVFCAITGSGVVQTAVAPLRAADRSQARGAGDLLSLARVLGAGELLAFVVAIGAGLLMAWYARRVLTGPDWLDALACGALISLMVFPHLDYDYCFLLPVAGAAMRRRGWTRVVPLTGVAVLWFSWGYRELLVDTYQVRGLLETFALLFLALIALVRSAAPQSVTAEVPLLSMVPAR